ncbi:MAG: 50S ribosomal protein L11 methyltransferase [Clostridia bacterium]|nr:50S ribosomal protein L11 methyltransferase [Oscillospiraceae bacterium]MBQ2774039.1 50S ribosomal protein L11 methyltransferase [Clostridia bacterium]MBQ3055890.1 50S ribosomal protein L11 methyltransferase [Clostridia bacterium]
MEYCKDWSQLKVTVKLEHLDTLVAIMSMLNNNLMIEDFSDIDLKTCYGDLIDESILNADKTVAAVSIFLPADRPFTDAVAFVRERMSESGFEGNVEIIGVSEEDWANSWKAYYKPLHIGKKMVIVPAWEKYEEKPGEIIVRMDPGMAFGTGTHETTRLVIELLETYTKKGSRVLDVGCGSGILAICAAKLGAAECKAYDIDPVAVRVARENIKDSGEENVTCDVSDLLKQVDLSGGKYDLVCANIVADIIIRMAPDVGSYMKDDAVLLASGIITERAEEVIDALLAQGLRVTDRLDDNGWCALVVQKA